MASNVERSSFDIMLIPNDAASNAHHNSRFNSDIEAPSNANTSLQTTVKSSPSSWNVLSSNFTLFGFTRNFVCAAFLCVNLVFWLPMMFCVIIPAVMQDIVNQSQITIQSVTISYPTSQAFEAINVQTFSNTGSIVAKGQISSLDVAWEQPNGGNMIRLGQSNTFTVKDNEQVTMTSQAVVVNGTAFSNFNLAAIDQSSVQWHLSGKIDVTYIITAQCNIDKNIDLLGFQGFPINPNVLVVNTTGGSTTALFNSIEATMTSTSNINILFGQTMNFLVYSGGLQVGSGLIANYSMLSGVSVVQADVQLFASNSAQQTQVDKIMTNYSTGYNSYITLEQFYTAEPISWLSAALKSITLETQLPPVSSKFVVNVTMYAQVNVFAGVPVTMNMYNPLDTTITVMNIQGSIYYQNVEIATMHISNLNFAIPSHEIRLSPLMTATPVVSGPGAIAYGNLVAARHGVIDVFTPIVFKVGDYSANVDYVQYNVTINVIPPK